MPATLSKDGDVLVLNLSGHPNFREILAKVKQIPGRRPESNYKGQGFRWLFPADEKTAIRIVHTVNPSPDATVMGWLREASARVADELSNQLPENASLLWTPPEGLELFDFQEPMIEFMAIAQRVIDADDMGLGKTIEAIGAVQEFILRHQAADKAVDDGKTWDMLKRPKLVVAGTTKLGDWKDELKTWAPGEPVMVVPGDKSAARRKKMLLEFERDMEPYGGWLIVNHEQLRAQDTKKSKRGKSIWTPKEPWFSDREWLALIGDEAHRWKNKDAQQTGGAMQIRALLAFLLTGTAIINSPDEMWALLAIIRPDAYEEWASGKITYWQFFNSYVEQYEITDSKGKTRGRVITGAKNTDELRFEVADKFARRTKKALRERGLLPDKLPTKFRHVEMRPAQAELYRQAEHDLWLAIEQDVEELRRKYAAERPDNANGAEGKISKILTAIESGEPLEEITRMLPNAAAKYAIQRQIATSPGLLGAKDDSGKLDAVIEDITDHKDKPFVVFTWHRRATELVAERLERKGISVEWMHGGTKYDERSDIVRRFAGGETQVLVTTIRTGGEGLNLVRADTALFVERSERVTDQDQAEDRVWRIGQKNAVNIVVYLSDGTVEANAQHARLRMRELMLGATIGRDRD